MPSLGEIANLIGAECHGDPTVTVHSVADINDASPGQISFITNKNYVRYLETTNASAIISSPHLISVSTPLDKKNSLLLMDNPYLGYAKISQLFDTTPLQAAGIHPSAVIAEDAKIADSASVGAQVVIESGCEIGEDVIIASGCNLGCDVKLGDGCRLWSGVNIYHGVSIGKRAVIHSGCVIGSDGFGFANDGGKWVKISQLGTVIVGDDFEAGANTTIDRGALNNTIIGNGVKLDNLVHLAHNVEIGDGSAMAATTGIAGGTIVGKGCTFAGRTSVIGHLEVCDNAHLTVSSVLTNSITEPGVYSSGDVAQSNKQWKRKIARMRQLDDLFSKVRSLEKEIKNLKQESED